MINFYIYYNTHTHTHTHTHTYIHTYIYIYIYIDKYKKQLDFKLSENLKFINWSNLRKINSMYFCV